MKLNLVKDPAGKIIATFENAMPGKPSLKPVLQPGHTVQEVEAPENYRADLMSFYQKHETAKAKGARTEA